MLLYVACLAVFGGVTGWAGDVVGPVAAPVLGIVALVAMLSLVGVVCLPHPDE